ncbi:hypothetical protein IJM16_01980 [Candidatus Saccharibacteria bacterium]|nr:hypothetical protein [Candidatus Saccharibacteria bacterium]
MPGAILSAATVMTKTAMAVMATTALSTTSCPTGLRTAATKPEWLVGGCMS